METTDSTSFSFHIKKQPIRNKKYFVYHHKNYPIDFDLLSKNSNYFYNNQSQFENVQYIDLIDEKEEQINLSDESIQAFISSCQNEPCTINQSSVIPLQYLAHKYEFAELIEITDDFINKHSNDLIFSTLLFKNSEGKEKFKENSFFDTSKEENFISTHLKECIQKEEMLSLPIPVLHRILKRFYSNKQKNDEITNDVTNFLFKCLDKYGKRASVLFNVVDFKEEKIDVVNRLLTEYSEKFDFNMINLTLAKTAEELTSDLFKQKEEYSTLFSEMKQEFKEQRSELIKMKEEEKEKQIQIEIQNQERIQKFLQEINKIKDDVDKKMKKIEDKFDQICKRQEEIIDNGVVSNYHQIISDTITVSQFMKFNDKLKEHFIIEIFKNSSNQKNNKENVKKGILYYKLMDFSNANENLPVIQFIKSDVNQLKLSDMKIEYLFENGSLSSSLIDCLNYFDDFLIELKYPFKKSQQIMNSIFDVKNKNDINSNKMKISITINDKDYFQQKFKLNKFINICKIGGNVNVIDEKLLGDFSNLSVLELCEGVTKMEQNSFKGCKSLTQIKIPKSVTSIENNTFDGCTSLTQITIPTSIKSIKSYAFHNCASLTQISIPSSITSIENGAFDGCTSLKQITIPSSVTCIGENCFNGCSKLDHVTIDPFHTKIEANSFNNCNSLNDFTIPTLEGNQTSNSNEKLFISSNMTEILFNIRFLNSSGFSSHINNYSEVQIEIKYPSTNFSNIYGIVKNLKQTHSNKIKIHIFYTGTETTDKKFDQNTDINSVKFDSSVKRTPNDGSDDSRGSFESCKSLTQVIIPSSFIKIGNYTFYGCSSLTQVIFENPSSLSQIGQYAFTNCKSLTQITIPSSVTSIEQNAFSGCSSLRQITLPSRINTSNLGINSNVTINRI